MLSFTVIKSGNLNFCGTSTRKRTMEIDTVFDPINRQVLLKPCRKVFEKLTDNGELPIESYLTLIKYFLSFKFN